MTRHDVHAACLPSDKQRACQRHCAVFNTDDDDTYIDLCAACRHMPAFKAFFPSNATHAAHATRRTQQKYARNAMNVVNVRKAHKKRS